jgi:hypothetical protein
VESEAVESDGLAAVAASQGAIVSSANKSAEKMAAANRQTNRQPMTPCSPAMRGMFKTCATAAA